MYHSFIYPFILHYNISFCMIAKTISSSHIQTGGQPYTRVCSLHTHVHLTCEWVTQYWTIVIIHNNKCKCSCIVNAILSVSVCIWVSKYEYYNECQWMDTFEWITLKRKELIRWHSSYYIDTAFASVDCIRCCWVIHGR